MKITIDTKEDSPEEIKKTISFLQELIGNQKPTEMFDNVSNLMSIFDNKPSEAAQEIKTPEKTKLPEDENLVFY